MRDETSDGLCDVVSQMMGMVGTIEHPTISGVEGWKFKREIWSGILSFVLRLVEDLRC